MLEATHIVKAGFDEVSYSHHDYHTVCGWFKSENRFSVVSGSPFDTEQEAVKQWNKMFSKAPYVAQATVPTVETAESYAQAQSDNAIEIEAGITV